MKKSCLLFLPPGFEEIEVVAPVDILRRGGVEVVLVSFDNDNLFIKGKQGIVIQADTHLQDVVWESFDGLILPGGPGVQTLLDNPLVINACQNFFNNKKLISAICAAPLVLYKAGLLENKRYTAHFSTVDTLSHIQLNNTVIQDEGIITANGPGAAILFGLYILRYLTSQDIAEEVANSICFTEFS